MKNKIDLLNGGYLYYNKGKFDNWCVYEIDENGRRKVPKDVDYFRDLYEYTKIFDNDEIYDDFIIIYDLTTNKIEGQVIDKINKLSSKYGKFKNDIFRIFATLYMGMIAEEHKEKTVLGKRIKRLGVYYLLIKLETPEYCANFMNGMSAREISNLCLEGGF